MKNTILLLTLSVASALPMSLGAKEADPDIEIDEPTGPRMPAFDRGKFERAYGRALQRLAGDPPVQRLVSAALERAQVGLHTGQRWRRTSRISWVAPDISASAEYQTDRDESLDRFQDRPDRWGADTDRDLEFRVIASWRLGKLIFNDDEIQAQKALEDIAKRREDVIREVVGGYFERRRLIILQYVQPLTSPVAIVERRQRIKELTETIDALTGGLLSRNLTR